MQNKQTAVEWLTEKYAIMFGLKITELMQEHIEKAKQMEKQQIIEAHIIGDKTYTIGGAYYDAAEKYYNETYKP